MTSSIDCNAARGCSSEFKGTLFTLVLKLHKPRNNPQIQPATVYMTLSSYEPIETAIVVLTGGLSAELHEKVKFGSFFDSFTRKSVICLVF